MIGKQLERKFLSLNNKFFFKLLFSYSIIVVIFLILFTQAILSYVSKALTQNQIEFQKLIVSDMADYFDDQISIAQQIIGNIYLADQSTRNDIFDMIQFAGDKDLRVYPTMKDRMDSFFNLEIYKDNGIVDIIIINNDQSNVYVYSKDFRRLDESFDFMSYPWLKNTIEYGQAFRIIPSYRPAYIHNGSEYVYTVTTSLFDDRKRTIGGILINFKAEQIKIAFDNYRNVVEGSIMIFDPDGATLYDSSGQYYAREYPGFERLKERDGLIDTNDEYIIAANHSKKNGFIVVEIVSKKQLLGAIVTIRSVIYWVLGACLTAILLAYMANSMYLSKKISVITKAMKEVQKGNLRYRIPVYNKNDEIDLIYRSFNIMCVRLEEYIDRVFLSEIRMKESEIVALQSQINPHFLYNTLESIRMKAKLDRNEEVAKMIFKLARFFRMTVKNKDIILPVQEEVKYCQMYLELHQLRYGERLRMELAVEDAILPYGTIKLILQPLVENVVLYGFHHSEEPLCIKVSGRRAGDTVVFVVEDNGVGIAGEALRSIHAMLHADSKLTNRGHSGLKSVHDRISLIFGREYGLSIESDGAGTRVKVTYPLMTVDGMLDYLQKQRYSGSPSA